MPIGRRARRVLTQRLEELLVGVEEGEQFVFADEVITDKSGRTFACAVSDRAVYFWNGGGFLSRGTNPLLRVPFQNLRSVATRGRDDNWLMAAAVLAGLGVAVMFGRGDVSGFWDTILPLLPAVPVLMNAFRLCVEVRLSNGSVLRWKQPNQKASGGLDMLYKQTANKFMDACRTVGVPIAS